MISLPISHQRCLCDMLDLPTIAAVAAFWILPLALYFVLGKETTYELHGYQHDFLVAMAAAKLPAVEEVKKRLKLSGMAAAMQALAEQAQSQSNIYDTFHCVHCGSKNPADWIKERKGKKEPYTLAVTAEASAFLATALIVPVQKLGEPPVRQVVDGLRTSNPSKAARVVIDWAIDKFGALDDGKPKLAKAKAASKAPAKSPAKSPARPSKSPKRR